MKQSWLPGLEKRDLLLVSSITSILWEFRAMQPGIFLPETVSTVENLGFDSYKIKLDKILDITFNLFIEKFGTTQIKRVGSWDRLTPITFRLFQTSVTGGVETNFFPKGRGKSCVWIWRGNLPLQFGSGRKHHYQFCPHSVSLSDAIGENLGCILYFTLGQMRHLTCRGITVGNSAQ